MFLFLIQRVCLFTWFNQSAFLEEELNFLQTLWYGEMDSSIFTSNIHLPLKLYRKNLIVSMHVQTGLIYFETGTIATRARWSTGWACAQSAHVFVTPDMTSHTPSTDPSSATVEPRRTGPALPWSREQPQSLKNAGLRPRSTPAATCLTMELRLGMQHLNKFSFMSRS